MKVFLANDTGRSPHVGCMAVSNAHMRLLASIGADVVATHYLGQDEYLYCGSEQKSIQNVLCSRWAEAIYKCDAVIVNGEGTIHHGAGLHLLAILGAAQQCNRHTFLVNAVLQDVDSFQRVFAKLTDLTVREPRSAAFARKLGAHPRVIPDSIMAAEFSDEPAEDFRNEIVVGDGHWLRDDVREALETYASGRKTWILHDHKRKHDWQHAVASLKTAKLYVTGRHHGIYLCALAGIPFVPLPSNTHKIESLIEWSGCNIPVWKPGENIAAAVDRALSNQEEYQKFQQFLMSYTPLSTLENVRQCTEFAHDNAPSAMARLQWKYYSTKSQTLALKQRFLKIMKSIINKGGR